MGKLLLSAIVIFALSGCVSHSSMTPVNSTAQQRAADSFAHNAEAIEEKESVANAPTTHVLADTAMTPGGSTVTLWVTDPSVTGIRSRCFYLDQAHPAGGAQGVGGCGAPTIDLSLSGDDNLLVGSTGSPAAWIRVSAGPDQLSVPVVGGYFLIPPVLTDRRDDPLSFTLLSAEGTTLGTATSANKPTTSPVLAAG